MVKGKKVSSLYHILGETVTGVATVSSGESYFDLTQLWHMRLGHAGEKAFFSLVKQGLLKGAKPCKLDFYKYCVLGKQTRVKFGTAIHNTEDILDYIHLDVWGPIKIASLGGMHYFVTFVDDFSKRVWVYVMKNKEDVLEVFLKWKKMIET